LKRVDEDFEQYALFFFFLMGTAALYRVDEEFEKYALRIDIELAKKRA